ncbi:hypothetical protein NUW58_g10274 [Xylaria curta]|uniref:Uncharacterized protein n=1 Tax=Xylaria curta TaxID=42375 RepID=A0ACC1MMY3_9PEZI|nr:hypothetical protein NUW58_g10274 [Xylaria curta]
MRGLAAVRVYKRCTNEPISEQDKARIMAKPKATMPMKPMINAPTKRRDERREPEPEQEAQERLQQKHQRKQQRLLKRQQKLYKRQRQQQQQEQRLHEQGDRAMGQTLASRGLGIGNGLELFDEKLRHIRSCSPRSRRRMAAQVLQWQAAIATVEAEDSALDASVPASFHTPVPNNANGSRAATTTVEAEDIRPTPLATPAHSEPAYNQFRVPFYRFAAPQTAPTSSATFTRHSPTERSSANHVIANYGAGNTPEPMEEDESESEHEDNYEGTPYAGTNGTGPVVKAPR